MIYTHFQCDVSIKIKLNSCYDIESNMFLITQQLLIWIQIPSDDDHAYYL